jgi:hypothetical protein
MDRSLSETERLNFEGRAANQSNKALIAPSRLLVAINKPTRAMLTAICAIVYLAAALLILLLQLFAAKMQLFK